MRKALGVVFGLALFPFTFTQSGFQASVSSLMPYRGDTVVVAFPPAGGGQNLEAESAIFDGRDISFFKYRDSYRAVFGVPATKPSGIYDIKIKFKNGEVFQKKITVRVKPGRPLKIALGIPQKLDLTPKKLVSQLSTQNSSINKVVSVKTQEIYFNRPFGLPLRDNRKISSIFGEIRQTGNQEIRHLGVDFDAKKGSPVYAINSGIVRKAYFNPIYGNSVILDHGSGIFSLYLHLDKILVKEGQKVKKGRRIATVGDSGYATQPHLHLSLKINGVSVDPVRFVVSFK